MKKYIFVLLFVFSATHYLLAQSTNQAKSVKHTTFNGIKIYIGQPKENVFGLLSPKYQIDISPEDSLDWKVSIKLEEFHDKALEASANGEIIENEVHIWFKNNKVSGITKTLYFTAGEMAHSDAEPPFETYKELFFILKKYCNTKDEMSNTIKLSSKDTPNGQLRYINICLHNRTVSICIQEDGKIVGIAETVR